MVRSGFIYVVVGERCKKAAVRSAHSLRKLHSQQICFFSDDHMKNYDLPVNTVVKLIDNPHRRSKVAACCCSPYEKSIFIDADTFIVGSLSSVFDILDRFEFAICHDNARVETASTAPDIKAQDCFPEFNTGFFAFTSGAINKILIPWSGVIESKNFRRDQPTLRALLWKTDARFYILPPEFNIRDHKYLRTWAAYESYPRVLHYLRFRDWEGVNAVTRIKVWFRRNVLINWRAYLRYLF